jgi:hypothetical protein
MVLCRLAVFFSLSICLTACLVMHPKNGFVSFSSYAESVFRHQNEVTSRLMMLSDADALPDNAEFEGAENAMIEACHALNDYAERESSGESLSLGFKTKVQESVPACDTSIQHLEKLLPK